MALQGLLGGNAPEGLVDRAIEVWKRGAVDRDEQVSVLQLSSAQSRPWTKLIASRVPSDKTHIRRMSALVFDPHSPRAASLANQLYLCPTQG